MGSTVLLANYVKTNPGAIAKIIDFNTQTDRFYQLDLTIANKELDAVTIADAAKFSQWINNKLAAYNCTYGVGGYMENRTIYAHSPLFNNGEAQRCHHLGVDIWTNAGAAIYAPLAGKVHSFKDNNNFGDYGPTIIVEHDLEGLKLYSLYGHLSRKNLVGLSVGQPISAGQKIANLGTTVENGFWPPHLHFQLMFDLEGKQGDYPGVCSPEEKEKYRSNIPDPQLILQFPRAVNV